MDDRTDQCGPHPPVRVPAKSVGLVAAQIVHHHQMRHPRLAPIPVHRPKERKSDRKNPIKLVTDSLDKPQIDGKSHREFENKSSQIIEKIVKVFLSRQEDMQNGGNVHKHLTVDHHHGDVVEQFGEAVSFLEPLPRFLVSVHPQIEAIETKCQQERVDILDARYCDISILVGRMDWTDTDRGWW